MVLPYSTGNYSPYPIINHNGKEFFKRHPFPLYHFEAISGTKPKRL